MVWSLSEEKIQILVSDITSDSKMQKFENGNGLEVYSVSLDKKYSSWIKAMTDDKLFWEYHVSDLKGWQSDGAAHLWCSFNTSNLH